MQIKCHQMFHGHTPEEGFNAPVIKSDKFPYTFMGAMRNLTSMDKERYVLEIEPVNSNCDCTAAICTLFDENKNTCTAWLVPEKYDTKETMRLLRRESFCTRQEATQAYKEPLQMRTVEVPEGQNFTGEELARPEQQKLLGQFLALYWKRLVINSAGQRLGNKRLLLLLKKPNSSEPMGNEEAIQFFTREIVARLPLEAQNMVSAVFGVTKAESDQSFTKAACVVLSSEKGGIAEKIDLFKGMGDLLVKEPASDRQPLKIVADYLLAGEQSYPEWYIKLRKLKDGIPKKVAPQLMYVCHLLQNATKLEEIEGRYMQIVELLTSPEVGAPEEDVRDILRPLLEKITNSWCNFSNGSMDFYRAKCKWLMEAAKEPPENVTKYTADLVKKTLEALKNNDALSVEEKLRIVAEMLPLYSGDVQKALENFMSQNFETWLFMENEEKLPEKSFTAILKNWESSGLSREPEKVRGRLNEMIRQYPGVSDDVTKKALLDVDRLYLRELVNRCNEEERHGSELTIDQLKELARQMTVVGQKSSVEEDLIGAMEVIEKNYHRWIYEESVFVREDKHFLTFAEHWLDSDFLSLDDYASEDMERMQENVLKVLHDYGKSNDEQKRALTSLRRKIALTKLKEIQREDWNETEKALKIAKLRRDLDRVDKSLLEDGSELAQQFEDVMLDYFLAWNDATPPFACGAEKPYDDPWATRIIEDWLKIKLKDLINEFDAEKLQKLENNIKSVFEAYHKTANDRDRVLCQVRIAKFEHKLDDVLRDYSVSDEEKALKIAGIHNEMRKNEIPAENTSDIEEKLTEALCPLLCAWSKAQAPFACDDNGHYDDKWFIQVARRWVETEMEHLYLSADELQELEGRVSTILIGKYKASKDDQDAILLKMRRYWAMTRLDEEHDTPKSEPQAAVKLAEAHDRLHRYADAFVGNDDLEAQLKEAMVDRFLAWEKADKPFVSGTSGHYDDPWFVSVADAWLTQELPGANLDAEQLGQLREDLVNAFNNYKVPRDQQEKKLLSIRVAWCGAKLEEIRNSVQKSEASEAALEVAGIHSELMRLKKQNAEEDPNLEENIRQELQDRFLAWSKAEKPFASGKEMKYEDAKCFMDVAKDWMSNELQSAGLSSEEAEQLETSLKKACGNHHILPIEQNNMLLELRRVWVRSKMQETLYGEMSEPEKAIGIASIHQKVRQIQGTAVLDDELTREMNDTMVGLFTEWAKASKPFASNEQGRYDDDWFVTVARKWLDHSAGFQGVDDSEIEHFEQALSDVLKAYHVSQKDQTELLRTLRENVCMVRLNNLRAQTQLEDSEQALEVAEIHREYHQIIGNDKEADQQFESEAREMLRERFVAWSEASKPFASGKKLSYDDNIFVTVATEWLENDIYNVELKAEKLKGLEEKLKKVFDIHRIPQGERNEKLRPLQRKWAETKLQEILSDDTMAPDNKADAIVEVHQSLQAIPNFLKEEEALERTYQDAMLDYFIEWSHGEKPFANGQGLSAGNVWYQTLLKRWCDERLHDVRMDAEALDTLIACMEAAAKNYRLNGLDDVWKALRRRLAECYIQEAEASGGVPDRVLSKVAEMLFHKDIDDTDKALYDRTVTFVGIHLEQWAMMQPAFCMTNNMSAYAAAKTLFPALLRKWQDEKVAVRDFDVKNAEQIRNIIQRNCEVCRIAPSEYEAGLRKLEILLCEQRIDAIESETLTPRAVVSLAGIRKKLIELGSDGESENLIHEVEQILQNNMKTWLDADQPLSVEGFAYRDGSVVKLVNDWLKSDLRKTYYSAEELECMRDRLMDASKQYRVMCGAEISQEGLRSIEGLYYEKMVQGLAESQTLTGEDGETLAVLYAKTKTQNEFQDICREAEKCLIRAFAPWGAEKQFGLPAESTQLASVIPLDDFAEKWLSSNAYAEAETLRRMREAFESASKGMYHVDQQKQKNVVLQLDCREADQLMKNYNGVSTNEEELRTIAAVYDRIHEQNPQVEQIAQLQNVFLDAFDQNTAVLKHLKLQDVTELTEQWISRRLSVRKMNRQELCQKRNVAEQLYNEMAASNDQQKRMQALFAIRVMNADIEYREDINLTEIASTERRVEACGLQLPAEDAEKLERFMTEQFSEWAKGGFKSNYQEEDYTYSRLPDVAKKWIQQTTLDRYSTNELERMETKLTTALQNGYRYTQVDTEKLVYPILEAKRGVLLRQRDYQEGDLPQLRAMYQEKPKYYGERIFAIYENFAKNGQFLNDVETFITLQETVWKQSDDQTLGMDIIRFLDRLCQNYAENVPEKLQDTMEILLQDMHYQVPLKEYEVPQWYKLRENLQSNAVQKFLKNGPAVESMADEWEQSKAEEYGLHWNELETKPFFQNAVKKWLDKQWVEEDLNTATEMCDIVGRMQNGNYRCLLTGILLQHVKQDFQMHYTETNWQDVMENALRIAEEQKIDTRAIRNDKVFGMANYGLKYNKLVSEWNEGVAVAMLDKKIELPAEMHEKMQKVVFRSGREELLLQLLYDAPFDAQGHYWDAIMQAMGARPLSQLDSMRLEEVRNTSFINSLQQCFDLLVGTFGQSSWLLDTLKNCVRTNAPETWKSMHGGIFISPNIKKLVNGGWNGLNEPFRSWLKDA